MTGDKTAESGGLVRMDRGYVTERPAEIRWSGSRLQQKWIVTTYDAGDESGEREEWRDVPVMLDDRDR